MILPCLSPLLWGVLTHWSWICLVDRLSAVAEIYSQFDLSKVPFRLLSLLPSAFLHLSEQWFVYPPSIISQTTASGLFLSGLFLLFRPPIGTAERERFSFSLCSDMDLCGYLNRRKEEKGRGEDSTAEDRRKVTVPTRYLLGALMNTT